MSRTAEFRLHCAAVRYLRLVAPNVVCFHVPNGEKREPATARRLSALGTVPGVFDLCMLGPDGRVFFAECKSVTGRLSESQEAFRRELIVRAIPYVIVQSLDDLALFLTANNIPNRLANRRIP
jgi:hypothetical protein